VWHTYGSGEHGRRRSLGLWGIIDVGSYHGAKCGIPITNVIALQAKFTEARGRHVFCSLGREPLVAHAPSFDAEDGVWWVVSANWLAVDAHGME
jgi:hypothetical protein